MTVCRGYSVNAFALLWMALAYLITLMSGLVASSVCVNT